MDGFATYREPTVVDFSDVDLFALVGPTGSGKSTVIDGICFALYGTAPRWGNENVMRYALAPSTDLCRVGLVFEAAGGRYAAARVVTRNSRGVAQTKAARLDRLDDAVPPDAPIDRLLESAVESIAEGDKVTPAVTALLGLSYAHFTQCVMLPQGRFADFLHAKPGDRQDLLVELLAYGVYERVGQVARERARVAAAKLEVTVQERERLAGATSAAERAAARRVSELAELERTVRTELGALAGLASAAAGAGQALDGLDRELDLLAGVEQPAGAGELAARITGADAAASAAKAARTKADRAESRARTARERLGDRARYLLWRSAQETLAAQQEAHDELAGHVTGARAAGDEAGRLLREASVAVEQAQAGLDAARRECTAAELAAGLRPGDDCPVCLRPLDELPHHEAAADLHAAQRAVEAARGRHATAAGAVSLAQQALTKAETELAATAARIADLTAGLAEAPDEGTVAAGLAAMTAADEALAAASRHAEEARAAAADAEQARARLTEEEREARTVLAATRDRLVALGAPPLDPAADLAVSWRALLAWVAAQGAERLAARPALAERAEQERAALAAAQARVLALLAGHGVTEIADPSAASFALAGLLGAARTTLEGIRRDRRHARRLDAEIAGHRETIEVAALLGELLKSNRFEAWLVSEALDSLVAEASETLMELSGGQYELDRTERGEIEVIDYNDAGTRRSVVTLSGGETFQASLALALALSRQVVSLSAGLRELDSMFLDEGFGTLDEATLDTVVTTLERLSADKDRMIGVVTHVPALAGRVPVQFAVAREGSTSRLRRVPLA
ncbi:MAG: AAA family ATPase [Frankiaceae bacterium]